MNLKYMLSGKAAEVLGILNQQAPELPYYDLIIRMERFLEAQEHTEKVRKSQTIYSQQILADSPSMMDCRNTYNACETPYYQDDENSIRSTLRYNSQQYTPFRQPCHQKQERYISYRSPQNTI